jgi:plasmid stabilization system protein ParE
MRLIYHPHARAELVEAATYYESRVPGLGAQFREEANRTASKILEAPRRWRMIDVDVRRSLIVRFPFAVYYRVFPDHVQILAVKHHKRHPDYWRHRLNE